MKPEYEAIMMETAREVGTGWLEAAIVSATSPFQAETQINVLQLASIHVLATSILNAPETSRSEDEFMEQVFTLIRAEYAYMKSALAQGELERVEHLVKERPAPDAGFH